MTATTTAAQGRAFARRAAKLLGGEGWQARFCRGSGVHRGTVRRWELGELPVPDYALSLLDCLEALPLALWPRRWVEATTPRPPPGRPPRPRRKRRAGASPQGAAA